MNKNKEFPNESKQDFSHKRIKFDEKKLAFYHHHYFEILENSIDIEDHLIAMDQIGHHISHRHYHTLNN